MMMAARSARQLVRDPDSFIGARSTKQSKVRIILPSRSLAMVVLEEAAEPFTALDLA